MLLVFSTLNFVAAADVRKNNSKIINGTPSYACFIMAKVVPALLVGVFAFRLGTGLPKSEAFLVGGILSFWVSGPKLIDVIFL